jgi:hypothetical protein
LFLSFFAWSPVLFFYPFARNAELPSHTLDLHGLHVDEALEVMKALLPAKRAGSLPPPPLLLPAFIPSFRRY